MLIAVCQALLGRLFRQAPPQPLCPDSIEKL
jgi:hypothetical protein